MNAVNILLILVALGGVYCLFNIITDVIKNKNNLGKGNPILGVVIGFITDFFDTLGISSFALTTLLFKVTNYLDNDKQLPGTLNVAHTIPTILEAFLFIQAVEVEPITMFSLIAAAILGSILGARIVTGFSERKIQTTMGYCLLVTSLLMISKQMGWLSLLSTGNTAIGLVGVSLIIGIVGNFIFGALMMAGVGLYAPCLAMVSILGMNPKAAFPIMMASCALLQAISSGPFIKANMYSRIATITIIIGGLAGVYVAFNIVKNMPLDYIMWLVIVVVIYTGISMIIKGRK
ncbi:sulfite exporter TauE/SafE family protein [Gemella sp. GH3]|uniref:sulfite exporter TauE/SafE family protein n=1 Tax=unclassified Gemella TaxID=2624949 RepID=UPI0015CFE3AC|nr:MULTISPECIES: sulfite exporter TauE/SafE family protein [unclassified Gemella]MBF0713704.1 sulfite exporter TauE/SafE family protein [Gemella sp. GH3.1]NYS50656.1 sulfite exporter TauE/SafE family protein [Gemella sp. GH3]